MPRITLLPSNTVVEVAEQTSVFEAAKWQGITVDTACGGKGTCGLCRVRIVTGFEALTPVGPTDKKLLGDIYVVVRERLACQARITGESCTVEIPPPRPSKQDRKRAAAGRAAAPTQQPGNTPHGEATQDRSAPRNVADNDQRPPYGRPRQAFRR